MADVPPDSRGHYRVVNGRPTDFRFLDAVVGAAARRRLPLLPVLLGLMVVAPDLIPAVFGSRWTVSVGVVQILSIYVLIRGLQSWGSVYMDAVGRPEVTFWTQLASLCLTPVAVVVGREYILTPGIYDSHVRRLLRGRPVRRRHPGHRLRHRRPRLRRLHFDALAVLVGRVSALTEAPDNLHG